MMKHRFPGHNIYTADILGNGKFHDLPTPLTIKENVDGLRMQVPKEGKKLLFGFSLGGMLTAEWAFQHPEEVEALILINTSFDGSPFYKRMTPKAFGSFLLGSRERDLVRREALNLKVTTGLADEQITELAPHWSKRNEVHPVHPANFARQMYLATQARLRPSPPPVPILILSSGKDRVVHPDCSKHIAEKWRVPLIVHPTAGHDLTLVDPKWTVDQVENWLTSLNLLKTKKPLIKSGRQSRGDIKNPKRRNSASKNVHRPVGSEN
jgi:pimeloyl-ACP methyl ester carboxylesterase